MPDSKLQFLIDHLQENLEVEVKNWLNGLAGNGDKATLAKEIIALANSGGGYIFIGFNDEGADLPEVEPQEGELEAFNQDAVSSVVQRYITPPCQCRVEMISQAGSDAQHPVIIVPGDHRTPLFAARGGPNGELDSGKVYVRRPGGNSEHARNQDDWEKLIERLVKARQSDMLSAIREVLDPSSHVLTEEESTLEDWHEQNMGLWREIVEDFDENDPRRLDAGYWTVSFVIQPFETENLTILNAVLDQEIPKYSGWPPFTYLHSDMKRPRAQDQFISAYLGGLSDGERPEHRVDFCDFWRISRTGQGFLLRPMEEDQAAYIDGINPHPQGPFFDWTTPIYRMTEILKYIETLSNRFGSETPTFQILLKYHETQNRKLYQPRYRYTLIEGGVCHSSNLESRIEATVEEISTNIEELVFSLLVPIYEQFDFTELPRQLVTNVVNQALENRR